MQEFETLLHYLSLTFISLYFAPFLPNGITNCSVASKLTTHTLPYFHISQLFYIIIPYFSSTHTPFILLRFILIALRFYFSFSICCLFFPFHCRPFSVFWHLFSYRFEWFDRLFTAKIKIERYLHDFLMLLLTYIR